MKLSCPKNGISAALFASLKAMTSASVRTFTDAGVVAR
jgi:hypothetical protein